MTGVFKRLTPAASESTHVDVELGLSQAGAIGEGSRGVRNDLELGLGNNVLLDE
jgi:hypothetical protein